MPAIIRAEAGFVDAGGHRLEFERLRIADRAGPVLVFLHEGLGSVSAWRGFPRAVVAATGCDAVVYSRLGYGRSEPLAAARGVDFMHVEALSTLPELLERLGIECPVLIGHSDGASIALLHAARSARPVRGVVAMAPHVMVEDVAIRSIERVREAYRATDLRARLSRHHDHPDSAFRGWNDIWLDPAFRCWTIEDELASILCPVLAIQGEDDEYGTMAQVERIAAAARSVELVAIPRCGHSPHRDQQRTVVAAIARFVADVAAGA